MFECCNKSKSLALVCMMTSVSCAGCCTNFKTQRALATHIQRQQDCKNFYQSVAHIVSTKTLITNKSTTLNENNIIVNDEGYCSNTDNNVSTTTNTDLIVQLEHFKNRVFKMHTQIKDTTMYQLSYCKC